MKSMLGARIRALRKEKNTTQEELGKAIGVTPQAVSNWEVGGTPDAELLPAIADFFGVSVDSLFGKTEEIQNDLGKAITWALHNTDQSKRYEKAFEYCWCINQGLFDWNPQIMMDVLKTEAVPVSADQMFYSILSYDEGISVMRLNENLHYFFLMPEPAKGKQKTMHSPEKYEKLFTLLGKHDYMKVVMFMYGRKQISLSGKILAKHLSMETAEAEAALEDLCGNGLLRGVNIETDQGEERYYSCCDFFGEMLSLVPFLFFASNLIDKPAMGFNNTSDPAKAIL
jgi:transcriptional regulator with XRE-family HTH domain